MRYFIVSDIHGFYKELIKELKKNKFNKNKDTLISLGDNFDRGKFNWDVYKFLLNLPHVILIRGNHEDLLQEAIDTLNIQPRDYRNGTVDTIKEIAKHYIKDPMGIIEYAFSLKNTSFYSWLSNEKLWKDSFTLGNIILTHSTLPLNNESWKDARWGVPYLWYDKNKDKINNTVICGHFATEYFKEYFEAKKENKLDTFTFKSLNNETKNTWFSNPFKYEKIIGIDACTALTHKLNVLIIDDKDYKIIWNDKELKDTIIV